MEKVLRASKAGFPCARNLWYSANGFEPVISPKTQRIFDVGTYLEPLVVKWLRDDGWDVEYNQGSQNAELEVNVPVIGGKLAGHPDCFISKGDTHNCLIDIKTMNDRAFTLWEREGSLKSKPQYVTQLHVYAMGCMTMGRKVDWLGIVAVNKNNSDWHIDLFKFNPLTAAKIKSDAEYIFSLPEPPSTNCPAETWCCSYCDFHHLCQLHKTLEVHVIGMNDTTITHDEDVIDAMKSLQQARELSQQARELEGKAKTVIDEKVKQQGLRSVQAENLILNICERSSSRFDSAAFKKAHPELVGQFTKQSTSTSYNLQEVSIYEN